MSLRDNVKPDWAGLRHVGISLGNLTNFVGGLGDVAEMLGRTLAARADALKDQHGLVLHFHTTPALRGCFGDTVSYLPVKRSQEWRHKAPLRMDVWHALNQLNRYPPPLPGARCLVTLHDLNYVYEKQGLSRWRHGWRMRQLLARMHAVVAITEHVAADIRRELRWSGPLQVIHNGVRDQTGAPQAAVPGLPANFFFHLSRMTRSKNVESLIEMMAAWSERHLVLAGPAADRNAELQAAAAQRGLTNITVLTGISAEQKAWLYAHCGAFFFPSITEGFGLPPVEAMHFGKPSFLAHRTSLPEVGGDAASSWHDFDPVRMRAVVEAGLANWTPARAQAAAARAAGFSWAAAADAYVQQYLALLDGSPIHPK